MGKNKFLDWLYYFYKKYYIVIFVVERFDMFR